MTASHVCESHGIEVSDGLADVPDNSVLPKKLAQVERHAKREENRLGEFHCRGKLMECFSPRNSQDLECHEYAMAAYQERTYMSLKSCASEELTSFAMP